MSSNVEALQLAIGETVCSAVVPSDMDPNADVVSLIAALAATS
jgi:hypothetical protein